MKDDNNIFTGEWYSQYSPEQLDLLRDPLKRIQKLEAEKKELIKVIKQTKKENPWDKEPLRVV